MEMFGSVESFSVVGDSLNTLLDNEMSSVLLLNTKMGNFSLSFNFHFVHRLIRCMTLLVVPFFGRLSDWLRDTDLYCDPSAACV